MRVRIRDGRQVVTEDGHHYGGELLDVADATATDWVRQGWADLVDAVLTPREGPSALVGRANVQARIREELGIDPTRSDRTIAAVVGLRPQDGSQDPQDPSIRRRGRRGLSGRRRKFAGVAATTQRPDTPALSAQRWRSS